LLPDEVVVENKGKAKEFKNPKKLGRINRNHINRIET